MEDEGRKGGEEARRRGKGAEGLRREGGREGRGEAWRMGKGTEG